MSEAGTYGTGQTITYGLCPGCKTLHRTSDCPDDNWREHDYCPCCEAISASVALYMMGRR